MAESGDADESEPRHVHIRVTDEHTSIYDLITEYLQSAGKAPDWYWRIAGRLEGTDAENLEELLSSAFEAGAYIAHEHPEDVSFEWVTLEECERQRRREESNGDRDANRRERGSLSHYA